MTTSSVTAFLFVIGVFVAGVLTGMLCQAWLMFMFNQDDESDV